MPTLSESLRRHAVYFQGVLRYAENLYVSGGDSAQRGIRLFEEEWANIQAGQAWAARHVEEDNSAASSCSYYPSAGANLLNLLLQPREHVRWLQAALAAARRLNDRTAEGRHLNNLGLAYADLGDHKSAIEHHKQALEIASEINNRRGEGYALGNLGGAYFALGELDLAVELYERRLAIARELGDRRGEGRALGNLGVIYKEKGELSRAIGYYKRDLVIAREVGNLHGEGVVLGNLGVAYRKLGDPRKAVEFHGQHLSVARQLADRRGEGIALFNMCLAYIDLGEPDMATTAVESALRAFEQIEDPNAAKAQRQLRRLQRADAGER